MSLPGTAVCELLPWDTEFFGRRIARVCGTALTTELAVQIDDWSRDNRVEALYFLSRADDPAVIRTAERHGFGLVDVRVTFEYTAGRSNCPDRSAGAEGILIRPFQPEDLLALQAMARSGHRDTRFFSDPHFSPQRAEDFYSTWITLESQGRAQMVFVAAGVPNQPVGYISCHLSKGCAEAQIGLVGVIPAVRGRGIGRTLVLAAVDWCQSQGAQMVTVVTQGRNRDAQRLYQRCGFLTRDLQFWYHKWYPVLV